jgi:hypothetical protein
VQEGVGDKVEVGGSDITEGGAEPGLFVLWVVILEGGDGGIVGTEVQVTEFFKFIGNEGDEGRIFFSFEGILFSGKCIEGCNGEEEGKDELMDILQHFRIG